MFDLSKIEVCLRIFRHSRGSHYIYSDEKIRRRLHDGVKEFSRHGISKTSEWSKFSKNIHYIKGDFKNLKTYQTLGEQCAKQEKEWRTKAHRIFYMATPPSMFQKSQSI